MNPTKAKTTVIAGVAAIALSSGLGWALVLSPRQGEISDVKAATVAAQMFNRQQQRDLIELRGQATNLAAQQAYAAGLTAKFPSTAAQPELFAEVQAAAVRAGLSDRSVTSLTPSAPLPDTVAPGGAAPLPAATGPATDGGAAPVPAALATMAVEVTVTGPYDALLLFLGELENSPRAYLISTVDIAAVDEADAAAYTVTVTGMMFVLPALTDPTAVPTS